MQQFKRRYKLVFTCLLAFALTFGGIAGGDGSRVYAEDKLGTPALTVVSRTSSSVNLKVSKVDGATGYELYRATEKKGTYTKIKTTSELTYKDTKTTGSVVYYYKTRAYKNVSGKKIYSSYSAIQGVKANLAKPANFTAKAENDKSKLIWSAVSGTDKYLIYRATSKNGTYQHLDSTKSRTYTDQNVKAGKTYYYKVRAYAKKGQTKYYSSYTQAVSVKAKKDSYQQEVVDLINKERKAAGLSPLQNSSTIEKAAYQRAKEIERVFSHTRPNGTSCFTVLDENNIAYRAAGENIAYGQSTPKAVMDAWMNSEGHRKNILSSSFGKVGIGYYVVNGVPYWVQLFTN